jgi:hypothetical protein
MSCLHANQHRGVASLFVSAQHIHEDSLMSRWTPIDYCRIEHA